MKNKTLNILKCVCAILIVFNHCTFPGKFGVLVKGISRIGVPIFFMISGYYVYNNNEQKILKKIIHISKILLFSCLFWLAFNIIRYYLLEQEELLPYIINFLNIKTIVKFLIFNVNCFWGHLWFINALLYCYIFEFVLVRFKFQQSKIINYLSYFLLFLYIIIDIIVLKGDLTYVYIIRNFAFVGMPFFTIGKIINKDKINIPNHHFLMYLILIMFLYLIELHLYVSELYISSIMLSVYLFICSINNPSIHMPILEYIGSDMSMYVYIIHPAVKYIIIYIFTYFNLFGQFWNFVSPIVMLIVTLLLSYVLSVAFKKNKKSLTK